MIFTLKRRKVNGRDKVGEVYSSNNYGNFEVIKYRGSAKIKVRFIATGYETYTQSYNIRRGIIKDKLQPTVHGHGFIGVGRFKASIGGKDTKEYTRWHDMIKRCYSEAFLETRPTYRGCTVCEEWCNYQVFAS